MNLRRLHALADLACDAVEAIVSKFHSNAAADELWLRACEGADRLAEKEAMEEVSEPDWIIFRCTAREMADFFKTSSDAASSPAAGDGPERGNGAASGLPKKPGGARTPAVGGRKRK